MIDSELDSAIVTNHYFDNLKITRSEIINSKINGSGNLGGQIENTRMTDSIVLNKGLGYVNMRDVVMYNSEVYSSSFNFSILSSAFYCSYLHTDASFVSGINISNKSITKIDETTYIYDLPCR